MADDQENQEYIICWNCRERQRAGDRTYSGHCCNCGYDFRGEDVEVEIRTA